MGLLLQPRRGLQRRMGWMLAFAVMAFFALGMTHLQTLALVHVNE